MRKLTSLQIDALVQVYKRSRNEPNTVHRVQKRILNRMHSMGLIQGFMLTVQGLETLEVLKPDLFKAQDSIIDLRKVTSNNKKLKDVQWFSASQNETLNVQLDNMIQYYGIEMIQQVLSVKTSKNKAA